MKSKTIGIIGGGQLGMMIAQAAHLLNAKAICLDPNPTCPAYYVADEIICAKYDDINALIELGEKSDVLTYEFENVPSTELHYLVENFNLKQGIKPLFDSQDRLREKDNAKVNGLNLGKYYKVDNLEDLKEGIKNVGYPCIYKTRTMGYDGHGQVLIKSEEDIEKVRPYLNQNGILEEFIKFDFEASIIMVRSKANIINFPIAVNRHKNGILDLSIAGLIDKNLEEKIIAQSYKFMESCDYLGILAIEYFIVGDEIYFNEMAPRPHNSGHYTIEGCNTSQYMELCRFLLDMEFVKPSLNSKTVMKNILGADVPNVDKLESSPNIHIHMYNKEKCLPKRKMGHITFTNTSVEEYNQKFKNYFGEE